MAVHVRHKELMCRRTFKRPIDSTPLSTAIDAVLFEDDQMYTYCIHCLAALKAHMNRNGIFEAEKSRRLTLRTNALAIDPNTIIGITVGPTQFVREELKIVNDYDCLYLIWFAGAGTYEPHQCDTLDAHEKEIVRLRRAYPWIEINYC